MVSKGEILKRFQKKPEKFWKVEIFEREGFNRKVCKICGKGFWSLKEREICPEHEPYGFIGNSLTNIKWDFIKAWKEFEKFFNERKHKTVKRYPVVSRWRPDLFFTIASIQDFQRIEFSGLTFQYPANPLIVPQICLRFNDLDNVGVTGKHLTCFQMSGQHAFNEKENFVYWKDECMELNFEFLTKVMGIPKEEIVYVEDLWAMPDFSALGPCIEAHSLGLELVNNVFMEFKIENSEIKNLPIKVVDVGWGHDRLPWFTLGTYTVYDAVFPYAIEKIKKACSIKFDEEIFKEYAKLSSILNVEEVKDVKSEKEKIAKKLGMEINELEEKISQIQAAYVIADHARALAFAISDGALPSNVGGGYNLRVILRRALNLIYKFNWPIKLDEISLLHVNYLKKMFPELKESEEEIKKIIQIEEKRFLQSKKETKKVVEKIAKEKKSLSEADLIKLYESKGIQPEQLIEAGLKIEIPPTFYSKLAQKHVSPKKEVEKIEFDISDLPKTKVLFYEEPEIYEFKAKVIKVFPDNWVVLDKTAFYPNSGGQLNDEGEIDGKKVLDVIKIGNIILHKISEKIEAGKEVYCKVDKERRKILTIHHDAVHIVNAAARKVLGNHVNQYGTEKDIDKARIDITHYASLSEAEVEKIEKLANEVVKKDLPIIKKFMERNEAEEKYGFRIYQGGYVPAEKLRIVEIPGWDVEACGGTHSNSTGNVRIIKIIRTKRIADGLVRIELVAGDVAINYLKNREKILKVIAKKLNVDEEKVPKKVKEIFDEWKKLRKKLRKKHGS